MRDARTVDIVSSDDPQPIRDRGQRSRDPWAAVLAMGDDAARVGLIAGLILASATHGAASARALTALYDLQRGVGVMREQIHEFLWTEYDVEPEPVKKPEEQKKPDEPPPPPPDPEPDPAPVIVPQKTEPPKDDPYDAPPKPAEAAKIITAPPNPDDPVDLPGFVSGESTAGPLGGFVSKEGDSKTVVKNPAASNTGKPNATGTSTGTPPPPQTTGPDLSKPAGLVGALSWNCPFPDEADAEQIDHAVVTVIVTVRPDGSVQSVKVANDPGNGFGRQARMCALGRKYSAGLDRTGSPTTTVTPPIRITFSR